VKKNSETTATDPLSVMIVFVSVVVAVVDMMNVIVLCKLVSMCVCVCQFCLRRSF
jgi:L-lysine 2,3-aminomutase